MEEAAAEISEQRFLRLLADLEDERGHRTRTEVPIAVAAGDRGEIDVGKWWRFSEYEVVDGCIRPTATATMKPPYDPWASIQSRPKDQRERDELAPHERLFRLVDDLKPHISTNGPWFAVTPEAEKMIVEWCNEFGLLGLLPHHVSRIDLAPRYTNVQRLEQKADGAYPLDRNEARVTFIRTGGGWTADLLTSGGSTDRWQPWTDDDVPRRGQYIRSHERPWFADSSSPPPYLTGVDLDPGWTFPHDPSSWGGGRVGLTWIYRFFTDAPKVDDSLRGRFDEYVCPMPLTMEFWRVYQEPVSDFVRAVLAFHFAYEGAWAFRDPGGNPRLQSAEPAKLRDAMVRAMSILRRLVGHVEMWTRFAPPVEEALAKKRFNGGEIEVVWPAQSLVSVLARMLIRDLQSQKFGLRLCQTCKVRYFFPRSYQHTRCGKVCIERDKYEAKKKRRHEARAQTEAKRSKRAAMKKGARDGKA